MRLPVVFEKRACVMLAVVSTLMTVFCVVSIVDRLDAGRSPWLFVIGLPLWVWNAWKWTEMARRKD